MTRRIAITLGKGGTGKTTTAISLAAGLAEQGQRCLLIDTDTQGQVAPALGVSADYGITHLITGDTTAAEAIVEARPNLHLLAGGRELAGLKRLISRKEFGGERTLAEALIPIERDYDFVLLDTPPSWDVMNVNSLFYVDDILSPVSLEALTLQGLVEFAKNVASVQQYRPNLTLRYILPTFFDGRVKKSGEILEQLQRHYGDRVCDPIRYNVRLSEAPAYGETIFEFAPRSAGAQNYRKLVKRIMKNGS